MGWAGGREWGGQEAGNGVGRRQGMGWAGGREWGGQEAGDGVAGGMGCHSTTV